MGFVEITLENIEIGANVVRKSVYEAFGPKHIVICRIEGATYNMPGEAENFIELKVYNPSVRESDYFRADEYLIEEKESAPLFDTKNPNRTFVKRKEEH